MHQRSLASRTIVANGFAIFSVTYIGDLVLATLTFESLWKESGRPLTVVTAPAPSSLLAADARVREVRLVRSSRALAWRAEVVREFARARRADQQIVNLELYSPRWGFLRTLCRWSSGRSRAIDLPALQADERNALRQAAVTLPHRSSYYSQAVGLAPTDPPEPRIIVPPVAISAVSSRLEELTTGGSRRIVVVHPGSSANARRAPLSLFAETLESARAEREIAVIVVGTAAEEPLASSLLAVMPSRADGVSWAGRLTLVELAALLSRADLFIGNDSGPLKLAEAVGAPTLSFWGTSAPSFAGPRGARHRTVHFDDPSDSAALAALSLLDR